MTTLRDRPKPSSRALHSDQPNRRFLGHGFVELLYTNPAFRRLGVASALLRHCETRCATPKLFISTNLSNKPMQALLAKLGCVMTGFIDNIDEGDPELVYFKRLPDSLA